MFGLYAFTLGLLSGIGCYAESTHFPSLIDLMLVIISFMTLILCLPRFKSCRWLLIYLFALLIGYGWAQIHANAVLSWSLPTKYIGKLATITGRVTHLPQQFVQSLQFDFLIDSICDEAGSCAKHNAMVRLHWNQAKQLVEPGQSLVLLAKLKPLPILANPGSRNQSKAYFLAKIRALGSVKKLISVLPDENRGAIIDRVRQYCLAKMAPAIESLPYGKILEALTLGVRQKFTKTDWEIFQKTGTSHLMAISGLHIGLIATLFWWLGQRIWRMSYRATCHVPAVQIGGAIGLVSAVFYSLLAGFAVPTQRALVMIAVVVVSTGLKRALSFAQVLCLAIMTIAIWDVLALYSEGFWLSVIAVFFLLALSQNPTRFASVKLQYALLIAMLPLTLLFFSQVSLLSPLTNFFAIPMVGWGVVPLALLGVAFSLCSSTLGSVCFYLADRIFALAWFLLEKMAAWPLYYEFSITPFQFILISIGCALLLLPKGIPWRWLGWLGFLPILFNQAPRPKDGEAWFYLLDIGQGLASVVQTRDHVLLFDAGPKYGPSDAGERILWPFFREKRIKTIDHVVLSHADSDHIGGFESISKRMSIDTLSSSEPNRFKGPWETKSCLAGEQWYWNHVQFEMLHPDSDFQGKKNERSCVLKVTVAEQSILISGDIEKHAEAKLLKYPHDKLQSNIVVVPHHGSLSSSTPQFVKALSPQYALIPVGVANQYGLPKEVVVKRYEAIGSTVLLTSQTGAIWFKLAANQPLGEPVLWREQQRKIWD
ncbi:MAG: DNA internalization-related competence protein ComEC/Rec2 [Gammaproteobacteria bacterium]